MENILLGISYIHTSNDFARNSLKFFIFDCLKNLYCNKFHIQTDNTKGLKIIIAGSLEAAYSLNWGAREIWGKGGGETLALL